MVTTLYLASGVNMPLPAFLTGTIGKALGGALLGGVAGGIERRIGGALAGRYDSGFGPQSQQLQIQREYLKEGGTSQTESQGHQARTSASLQYNELQARERMQARQHAHEMQLSTNGQADSGQPPWWLAPFANAPPRSGPPGAMMESYRQQAAEGLR